MALGPAPRFVVRRKVRFSHCDPAGLLQVPQFLDMVNAAVEDWFSEHLGMPFDAFHLRHGYGNPVVATRCEIRQPCRFGEELELELAPVALGRSSIRMRLVARVGGEERLRAHHATAMTSLRTQRTVALPADLRERAERYLQADGEAEAAPPGVPRTPPPGAFRSRQLVRHLHCDPGGFVYFPRFFELFAAVLEDWCAALGYPWGEALMAAGAPELHTLAVGADFRRACRTGEALEFALWLERLGRRSFDLALAGACGGEERLRASWRLSFVSPGAGAMPIPPELGERMQRFGA